MVHALVDAGEGVMVLDNLATGFDWAVAQGASLVTGDVGDQARVAALIAQHRVDAVIHFAVSVCRTRFAIRSAITATIR
jgi:UDP-glucose 4-epimerase